MKKRARGIGVIFILLAGLSQSGCPLVLIGAGAGAGAGAMVYVNGELKQAYAAAMENVWAASLAAAEELKLKPSEKSIDNLDQHREIKGKTEDKRDFQIFLEATAKDVTTVKVRIGMFGDEASSKKIHEVIARNLKKEK